MRVEDRSVLDENQYEGVCKDLYVALDLCVDQHDRSVAFKKCQTEIKALRKCVEASANDTQRKKER